MSPLERQLRGYRLTTAEITYRRPDRPVLLQTYVWQDFDLAPRYPVLAKFLDFWTSNLDGKIHSIRLASVGVISAGELKQVGHSFIFH